MAAARPQKVGGKSPKKSKSPTISFSGETPDQLEEQFAAWLQDGGVNRTWRRLPMKRVGATFVLVVEVEPEDPTAWGPIVCF